MKYILFLAGIFSFVWSVSGAESTNKVGWFTELYTKREFEVLMRDGVRLHTAVYVPKDDQTTYPILLLRTPYNVGAYGSDNYPDAHQSGSFEILAKDKFIIVMQDVRGRGGSGGEFVHVRPYRPNKRGQETDESSDAWDTVDWLVKNVPFNNGKVGLFGISYPGFYAAMGAIDSHPALKAVSPQAPIADWFVGDDDHRHGALCLGPAFNFYYWFDQPVEDPIRSKRIDFDFRTPDGYDFFLRMGPLANADRLFLKGKSSFWKELLTHENYDEFWKARNIRPHLKNIHCAVMTVGGWYDAEDLFGALETYRHIEEQNRGITNILVMGPWSHGQWGRDDGEKLGDINFRAKTGVYYREQIELQFFRHFLKADTNFALPEALVFETGTHQWRRFDSWPPKATTESTVYFRPQGGLSFEPPSASDTAFDEYVSQPSKPVPFTSEITLGWPASYMINDQRFAANRPDVLVYETDPLESDLTLAGPVSPNLYVSTTGTDADWVVKLIDVYSGDYPDPDPNPRGVRMGGYQQLVRAEPFRGRFRESYETPKAFNSGETVPIAFTMPDVFHTFRRGHRVMIQIQSSWFPLIDRNPQTFVRLATATAEDFQNATQRVYRTSKTPSGMNVRILPQSKP